MKKFWNQVVMLVTQLCEYTKTTELYSLKCKFKNKRVNSMVGELYLNKAIITKI